MAQYNIIQINIIIHLNIIHIYIYIDVINIHIFLYMCISTTSSYLPSRR